MGSVHKFKRPPKNEQQFRGYRAQSSKNSGPGAKPARWLLSDWLKSVIAWSALVLVAVGFWAVGQLMN